MGVVDHMSCRNGDGKIKRGEWLQVTTLTNTSQSTRATILRLIRFMRFSLEFKDWSCNVIHVWKNFILITLKLVNDDFHCNYFTSLVKNIHYFDVIKLYITK